VNFEIIKTNKVIVLLGQQSPLFDDDKTHGVILRQF